MDWLLSNLRIILSFLPFLLFCFTANAATVTWTVGAAGTHTTVALAYAACTTPADDYIIEIRNDYANTEAKPITLTQLTNSGVIIRPQVAMTINTTSVSAVFYFNGADNVTIDGRVNSTGSTPVLTISTTYTVASASSAIKFDNDATNNTVQYCLVQGSSSGLGIIYFASGPSTANDNNTVDHCTISKSTVQVPSFAIYASGTSGEVNDNITISNCNILDFSDKGIRVNTYCDSWTITGNSFYQTASYTPVSHMYAIYINSGSNHTVSDNFFGGQAPSCGGSAYTLSVSPYYLTCIYFSSTVTAGTCTVNGNTIKNFNITTNGSPQYCFIGIYCHGTTTAFNIGAAGAGNGNAIGDTVSGTGSILITASGTPSYIFRGIQVLSTGVNSVKYNAMGAITCTGTATGASIYLSSRFIEVLSGAGATTIQYNTIGNPATLANISFPVAGNTYGFTGILYSANSDANISYNLIQNVSSLGSGDVGEEDGITVENTGRVNTIGYNTVGNSTANNIVFGANRLMHGIWFSATTSSYTSTGNVVQNFNLTSAGTSVIFHGQCLDAFGVVNFINDTVRNITIAGTTVNAADPPFEGFRIKSTGGAGQLIHKCAVKNISSTATTANVFLAGIFIQLTSSGDISRCHVSGNSVASTGASAMNYGMFLKSSSTWNVYNNVVLLDNGGNTSPTIAGIDDNAQAAIATNIYHNSVKIYGTGTNSSAACNSSAFRRESTLDAVVVKNNVWQNIRNGGTGKHFACYIGSIAGTKTFDYNYLETSAAPIASWNAVDKTAIADWRTSSGASVNEVTGTVTIENVKGFSNNTPIPGGGLTGLTPAVTDDKEFWTRANPPWIGAWEKLPASMPVEMLNFRGRCREDLIVLEWTTASETNNDYFSIERSADGKGFQSVGKVYGFGTSSVMRSYEFTDNEIQSEGMMFYRIKQVDYNGQHEYFGPVSVRCNSKEIEINPTVSDGIYFITGDLINAEVSVYSLLGEKINPGNRVASSVIDISNQSSGIYFVKVVTTEGAMIRKVIKQ